MNNLMRYFCQSLLLLRKINVLLVGVNIIIIEYKIIRFQPRYLFQFIQAQILWKNIQFTKYMENIDPKSQSHQGEVKPKAKELNDSIPDYMRQKMADQKNKKNIILEAKNIKYQDLQVVKDIGQNFTGDTTLLVTDKMYQNIFTLRTFSKNDIIEDKYQKIMRDEKEAMLSVSSPFISEFIRSYKDEHYIYFLTEYSNGVRLGQYQSRPLAIITYQQATFYAAQMVLMLEEIHSKQIIHRTFNPTNINICQDGYLKLTDFNSCKILRGDEKTSQPVGSTLYTAPQVFLALFKPKQNQGYSYSVDLWSMGVMLYILMTGTIPYGDEHEDPGDTYRQILEFPITFPKRMDHKDMNSFISQLLSMNPEARLKGSFSNLKKHANQLMNKTMKPPSNPLSGRLLDMNQVKNDIKTNSIPLTKKMHSPKRQLYSREGLNPKWDSVF